MKQIIHSSSIQLTSALLLVAGLSACNLHRDDKNTGSDSEPQSTSTHKASGLLGPQARDSAPVGDNQPAARSVESAAMTRTDSDDKSTGATKATSRGHVAGKPASQLNKANQAASSNKFSGVVHGSSGDSFNTTGRSGATNTGGTLSGTTQGQPSDKHYIYEGIAPKREAQAKNGLRVREILEQGNVTAYKVIFVPPSSSHARMGLKVGDVITSINGRPVRDTEISVTQLQLGSDVGYMNITRKGQDLQLPADTKSATTRAE